MVEEPDKDATQPGTADADWEAEGGALPDGPQTEHPISPAARPKSGG